MSERERALGDLEDVVFEAKLHGATCVQIAMEDATALLATPSTDMERDHRAELDEMRVRAEAFRAGWDLGGGGDRDPSGGDYVVAEARYLSSTRGESDG